MSSFSLQVSFDFSLPKYFIFPEVALMRLTIILKIEVFPELLWPKTPSIYPSLTLK